MESGAWMKCETAMKGTERTTMTIKARTLLLAAAIALAIALPSYAYDNIVTHPQLTIVATQKSVLYTDGTIMFKLGLAPADIQGFIYRGRDGDNLTGARVWSTAEFVAEGAYDEDDGKKALNHFFDPVHNTGLGIPIVCTIFTCERSWVWMTEPLQISGQDFSVVDANNYLYKALTFNDGAPVDSSNERGHNMALMFLALGHLQHHMQDMTQPQHVRNDVHYDKFTIPGYSTPSRYEAYTASVNGTIAGYALNGSPVYPGAPAFDFYPDFWRNGSQLGVAQFTNSNYLSYGTNFSYDHGVANANRTFPNPMPSGSHPYTVGDIFGTVPPGIQTICGLAGADCTMTMYDTSSTVKASTLSLFDQDLSPRGLRVVYSNPDMPGGELYATEKLFALNRFNFDAVHPQLIPVGVGYSAGIVNFFFRGKLDVTAPQQGPIAIVDHSTNTGFSSLKLTVKNTTPNAFLLNGTLQAVAHFHRNFCYQADLSGEFEADLVPKCPNYRSDESYVRLANATSTTFSIGESKDLTFTFADPIPLDATDLIIQVFYRGQIGLDDGIALGAIDVSEPTFVALNNASDVFELGGSGFFYYQDIINGIANPPYSIIDADGNHAYNSPPDVNVVGGTIKYTLNVEGQDVATAFVPQGRFARVAMLVRPIGFNSHITAQGQNGFFFFRSDDFTFANGNAFPAKIAQVDYSRNLFIVAPVAKLRQTAFQYDCLTNWEFYPSSAFSIDGMLASQADSATVPVASTVTP